jgi:hypothetical protein
MVVLDPKDKVNTYGDNEKDNNEDNDSEVNIEKVKSISTELLLNIILMITTA